MTASIPWSLTASNRDLTYIRFTKSAYWGETKNGLRDGIGVLFSFTDELSYSICFSCYAQDRKHGISLLVKPDGERELQLWYRDQLVGSKAVPHDFDADFRALLEADPAKLSLAYVTPTRGTVAEVDSFCSLDPDKLEVLSQDLLRGSKSVTDYPIGKDLYSGFLDDYGKPHDPNGKLSRQESKGLYEGSFVHGVKTGIASLTRDGRLLYHGDFHKGEFHGLGTYNCTNDDVYEGEFVDGRFCGQGEMRYKSGALYRGEFKEDRRNGYGVYTFASGDVYEGYFRGGKYHGKGTYRSTRGLVYEGNHVDGERTGKGKLTLPSGNVYEGDFQNGYFEGKGTYTFPSGNVYEGDFHKDMFEGKGVYRYPNGAYYEGDFHGDLRTGKGSYHFANGNVYTGDFVDGDFCGEGEYRHTDGTVYKGQMKEDLYHGRGSITYPNGDSYEGEWQKGKRHGEGTYHRHKQWVYKGEFKDGQRHGYGRFTFFAGGHRFGWFAEGNEHGLCIKIYKDGSNALCLYQEGKVLEEVSITADQRPNLKLWQKVQNNPAEWKGKLAQIISHEMEEEACAEPPITYADLSPAEFVLSQCKELRNRFDDTADPLSNSMGAVLNTVNVLRARLSMLVDEGRSDQSSTKAAIEGLSLLLSVNLKKDTLIQSALERHDRLDGETLLAYAIDVANQYSHRAPTFSALATLCWAAYKESEDPAALYVAAHPMLDDFSDRGVGLSTLWLLRFYLACDPTVHVPVEEDMFLLEAIYGPLLDKHLAEGLLELHCNGYLYDAAADEYIGKNH